MKMTVQNFSKSELSVFFFFCSAPMQLTMTAAEPPEGMETWVCVQAVHILHKCASDPQFLTRILSFFFRSFFLSFVLFLFFLITKLKVYKPEVYRSAH